MKTRMGKDLDLLKIQHLGVSVHLHIVFLYDIQIDHVQSGCYRVHAQTFDIL